MGEFQSLFSWILTKGGGKAELGRENFNPCFLGFQLEFLCQTELLKREFQSLFSWISTESREGVLKRSLKLSILVFLDFNECKETNGNLLKSYFQSLFSWILT